MTFKLFCEMVAGSDQFRLNLDEMNDSGFFVKPTVILDFPEFLSTL